MMANKSVNPTKERAYFIRARLGGNVGYKRSEVHKRSKYSRVKNITEKRSMWRKTEVTSVGKENV